MARRASFTFTASPLGEEEAVPSGRGAKGVAVPPWKRREAGGVGGHSGPSIAGYQVHQHEVERCKSLSVSGVWNTATSTMRNMVRRSGREQALRYERSD